MKGFPLNCFDRPTFEEDGLEFFVCNGGTGLTGVRKKTDPARIVFVGFPEIAQNLNMQLAKRECAEKRFGVRAEPSGLISFMCQGQEVKSKELFKLASKADWKTYLLYLDK
jgi:hypothetical protein